MLDNTLLAIAGVAGLHYAATAYVGSQAKHQHITTPGGETLRAVGHVSSLHMFPIKSFHRMDVEKFTCTNIGSSLPKYSLFDRHFLVVKGNGRQATLTEFNRMTFIRPRVTPSSGEEPAHLLLEAPGMNTLTLPCKLDKTDSSQIRKVDVYGQNTYGIDCGDEAGRWISTFLGKDNMRLLYFAATVAKRPASGGLLGEVGVQVSDSAQLAYTNAAPHNILSEASVELLNQHLKQPVSVQNFRPNIVVAGCAPNAEDFWDRVQIGNAVFKSATLAPRCPRTTVNPDTGVMDRSTDPLKTLRKYRPTATFGAQGPFFGVHMTLEKPGEVRVGDTVYASAKPSQEYN